MRSLGYLVVTAGGRRIVDWGRRQAEQVFKLLLSAHPDAVPRDVLAEALWPELDVERAGRRLSNAVSHLRRALGHGGGGPPQPWVVRRSESYRLVLGADDTWDVEEVMRLEIAAGEGDVAAARQIVALCRGEYLARDRYADWAEPVRREMAQAVRRSLRQLRESSAAAGDWRDAAAWAERVVHRDPASEEDLARLVALLVQAGEPARAGRTARRPCGRRPTPA